MTVWSKICRIISRRILYRVEETILVQLHTRLIVGAKPAVDGEGVVQWDLMRSGAWSTPQHRVYPIFVLEVQQWIRDNLRHPCGVEYDDESVALRYIRHNIGEYATLRIWFVSRDEALRFKLRWL